MVGIGIEMPPGGDRACNERLEITAAKQLNDRSRLIWRETFSFLLIKLAAGLIAQRVVFAVKGSWCRMAAGAGSTFITTLFTAPIFNRNYRHV